MRQMSFAMRSKHTPRTNVNSLLAIDRLEREHTSCKNRTKTYGLCVDERKEHEIYTCMRPMTDERTIHYLRAIDFNASTNVQ